MSDFDLHNLDDNDDPLSEGFVAWDNARKMGIQQGYFDADELCEIIDTYLSFDKIVECNEVIEHAIKIHPDNEDMVFDIMQMLFDYELWDELLKMTDRYKSLKESWVDSNKIVSLLHLCMEENAFSHFSIAKKKHAGTRRDLIAVYLAMGESLYNVDLYEAAIDVINEILQLIKPDVDETLLWVLLQSYQAVNNKEKVVELCEQLTKLLPMSADIWSRAGIIYKEIGEKEKSIDAFEFAVTLGKNEPIDILNLIYSYKENGNLLKALEKADEYMEKNPNDYIINLLAANICIEMEDWERALGYTDKALIIDSSVEFLYLYKSKCYANMGEIKKAIMALEDGMRMTADSTGEIKQTWAQLRDKYPDIL